MPPLKLPVYDRPYLDNSILGSFGSCQRKAFYNYRLNRAAQTQSYAIDFGSVVHDFADTLERLYQQWVVTEGKDFKTVATLLFEAAYAKASKGWEDPPIEHKKSYLDATRLRKTCHELYERFVEEKRVGSFKVIATEAPFCLPLPDVLCWSCFQWSPPQRSPQERWLPGHRQNRCPHCGEKDLHTEFFAGKIDQVIEWNRRVWIRDWKTTGYRRDWRRAFNPDHQFTGYVWGGQILSGRDIDGVIVNIIYNIKTKGPEFYPVLCNRSSNDIEMWHEWVQYEYAEYRRAERSGIWPMRTNACGDYGGCFFRDCCNTGSWPSIQEWLKRKTIHSLWDTLNPDKEEGLPE